MDTIRFHGPNSNNQNNMVRWNGQMGQLESADQFGSWGAIYGYVNPNQNHPDYDELINWLRQYRREVEEQKQLRKSYKMVDDAFREAEMLAAIVRDQTNV